MSQAEQILAHLESGRKVTGMDALELFQCWRLPARIYDLRRKGHDIRAEDVYVGRNRKRVSRYFMER